MSNNIKYNWLDKYHDGGGLEHTHDTPETAKEKTLIDKDSNRPVQTEKVVRKQNIRGLQQLLFDEGYFGEEATKKEVDGYWGEKTQKALEKYEADNSGFFGDQLSPTLPLNVSALRNDISGSDAPISRESLSAEELKALQKVVRGNLAKGKNYIEYGDYGTTGAENPYADVGAGTDATGKALDPAFNLKTTLGQATIGVTPTDTLVFDRYNFNNAREGDLKSYLKDIKDAPSIYNLFRSAGTNFGSGEGEGAPVLINTNQEGFVPTAPVETDSTATASLLPDWLTTYNDGGELTGGETGGEETTPTEVPAEAPAAEVPAETPTTPVDNPVYIEGLKTAIGNTETGWASSVLGLPQYGVTNKALQEHFGKKKSSSATGKFQILKSQANRIKKFGDLPKNLSRNDVMTEFQNNPQLQEDYMDNLIKTEYLPQTKKLDSLVNKYGREAAIAAIHLNGYTQAKKLNKYIEKGEEDKFKVKGAEGNLTTQEYMSRFQSDLNKEADTAIKNKTSQGLIPEVKNNILSFAPPTETGVYPGTVLPELTVQQDGGWLDKY